ncbi:MAG: hypothetical protein AAFP19_01695 [Bacteroidota bacterium]
MKSNAMQSRIGYLSILLLLISSLSFAQDTMTPEKWQEDLQFLQTTVHEDFPFLFKKISQERFDQQAADLSKALPSLSNHEAMIGLARLVSAFGYGHTRLILRDYHQLQANFYQFSDGVFVEGVHKDFAKALGAKVLAVEGKPIAEVLKAIYPVVSAENDQFAKGYGMRYLGIPEVLHAQGVTKTLQKEILLTLEKDGQTFEQKIAAIKEASFPLDYGFSKNEGDWLSSRDQSQTPNYLKDLNKIYYYEYLPDSKTVYVRHSQIQDDPSEPIPAFYERVFDFVENNEVERLVLDVRLNGGGNNYKNKPIVRGVIQTEKIDQVGKFFVIIGRRTFSACQNLVNELDNYTNAVFVGEPTSENINFYGDNRPIQLPNSQLTAVLSFAWWQDKPQWADGPWTTPHLAVEMSFEEYQSNQDPALDQAIQFDNQELLLDPMGYLTELFQAQKMAELEKETIRMVNDPAYRFYDFEQAFDRTGYLLLDGNQIEAAMYVFQMNTQLFPDSANCYRSLAEALLRTKQNEKAMGLYQKALQMDPDGPVGEKAAKMLEKIKGK